MRLSAFFVFFGVSFSLSRLVSPNYDFLFPIILGKQSEYKKYMQKQQQKKERSSPSSSVVVVVVPAAALVVVVAFVSIAVDVAGVVEVGSRCRHRRAGRRRSILPRSSPRRIRSSNSYSYSHSNSYNSIGNSSSGTGRGRVGIVSPTVSSCFPRPTAGAKFSFLVFHRPDRTSQNWFVGFFLSVWNKKGDQPQNRQSSSSAVCRLGQRIRKRIRKRQRLATGCSRVRDFYDGLSSRADIYFNIGPNELKTNKTKETNRKSFFSPL